MIGPFMSIHFRRFILNCLGLLVFVLFLSSCSSADQKPIPVGGRAMRQHLVSPKTVVAGLPIAPNPDTCKPPQIIVIPTQPGKTTHTTAAGKTLSLSAPESKSAGFYSRMQNYNTEQGLALSAVSSGFMDRTGNLWFGTEGGGVSRYDGKSFVNYTTAQGLANNNVYCITQDRVGNLWFGTEGGGVSRYDGQTFVTFNTKQGLANNIVFSIAEDKAGNMWFGTLGGGVSRYDGNRVEAIERGDSGAAQSTKDLRKVDGKFVKSFTSFTNAQGLPNNNIYCIIQDRKGDLWFGTNGGGASRYNGKYFTNYSKDQGLPNNIVFSIHEDKTGKLWFGTNGGGVSCYDGKLFTTHSTAQGLTSNVVYCITEDKEGILWMGTLGGGVSRYDGKSFINYTTAQGLPNDVVFSITSDKTGNLWFGTEGGGASRFDGRAFTNYTTWQGLSNPNVYGIMQDKKGNLWFGTNGGGAVRFDEKTFTAFSTAQGLGHNVVFSITEDHTGNIWFGTLGGGVSKYDGRSFTNFTTAQGLSNNVIRCVTEDNVGNLWFGTNGGGVSCYTGNKGDVNEKDVLHSIQADMRLTRYKEGYTKICKSFLSYTTDQGLAGNVVFCITQDKTGCIWFGTEGGGVSRFDGKTFTAFTTAQGLANNVVYCITEDKAGNLWFGTETGLSVLSRERNTPQAWQDIKMNEEKPLFKKINTDQGLADNFVTNISESPDGMMYVGTNQGISVISGWKNTNGTMLPSPYSDALANANPVFKIYNQRTGYPVKDINGGGKNAMFIDRQGSVWAGTGDDKTALVRFNPGALNHTVAPPIVAIQAIKINEENICWNDLIQTRQWRKEETDSNLTAANIVEEVTTFGRTLKKTELDTLQKQFAGIRLDGVSHFYPVPEQLVLPYEDNNITFEFNAIEPAKPYLVNYQYRLEGYDKSWSPVTKKTNATFGNIYEGTYTFKLKAQSPEGIWSEAISYRFGVLPPWYRTWWMDLLYCSAAFIALFGLYRWRTAALRKRERELASEVLRKTAEVVEQKEEAEKQKEEAFKQRELADSRRIIAEEQKHVIENQKTEVEKQKQLVEAHQKEIVDSINYARRLQQAILPSLATIKAYLPDSFLLYRPKDIVAGDFYWMHTANDTLLIAAADCTGHGVPGALVSIVCSNALNRTVNEFGLTETGKILDKVTELVLETFAKSGEAIKDGMDISLLSINKKSGAIEWSGANNPLWIVNGQRFTELKPEKQPIGLSEKRTLFTTHKLPLVPGDTFYLLTDGYADQFGTSDKKLMKRKFKDLILSIQERSMDEQQKFLDEHHTRWKGNMEQTDDVTVIGIRIA